MLYCSCEKIQIMTKQCSIQSALVVHVELFDQEQAKRDRQISPPTLTRT